MRTRFRATLSKNMVACAVSEWLARRGLRTTDVQAALGEIAGAGWMMQVATGPDGDLHIMLEVIEGEPLENVKVDPKPGESQRPLLEAIG